MTVITTTIRKKPKITGNTIVKAGTGVPEYGGAI